MIYTIGLVDLFEAGIDLDIAIKLGPNWREDGTTIPAAGSEQTPEEARHFLVLNGSFDVRRVYGVMADWDRDNRTVPGQLMRCLNRDARVVRVPQPD